MKINNYTVQKFDIEVPINVPGGAAYAPMQPGEFRLSLRNGKEPVCARFLCPCGCGKTASIDLQGATYHPPGSSWTYDADVDDPLPTVSPSVYMTGWPCQSHFFLKAGKIQWC